MVELDLLIVGGYYGKGRRKNLVSHFLLAVAQPSSGRGESDKILVFVDLRVF